MFLKTYMHMKRTTVHICSQCQILAVIFTFVSAKMVSSLTQGTNFILNSKLHLKLTNQASVLEIHQIQGKHKYYQMECIAERVLNKCLTSNALGFIPALHRIGSLLLSQRADFYVRFSPIVSKY